ncbi:MAG: zinc ribbon domain-containing protein [Candidatus Zixiibacteriota bacterium]|nr:MAG: zinc ribbon domain-containing protein [candidate division Zixibacteria bacterium]
MPIYEYRCKDCRTKFEVLVFSSDSKMVCEKCGSEDAERLMSGFASAFSGSSSASSCGTGGRFT